MNLTFLIPVKIESEDRVRNLITVLSYLLTKVDAKIIVKECDIEQKFPKLVKPVSYTHLTLPTKRIV